MKQYLGLFAVLLAASLAAYHHVVATNSAAPLPEMSRAFPVQASAAASAIPNPRPIVVSGPKRADFKLEVASHEARHVADWVVDSGDHRRMPFAIVDKTDAKVFVFDADGGLSGAAPALLGLALGDDSVPGIGDRALSSIRPEERTTPAGRFVAELGPSLSGGTVLWVNYDEGLAIHALRPADPKQRRPQRLASATPFDRRISMGCVVVPVKFFADVVLPTFQSLNGVVYVLPDTKLLSEVFATYDVEERARRQSTSQATSAQVVASTAPL